MATRGYVGRGIWLAFWLTGAACGADDVTAKPGNEMDAGSTAASSSAATSTTAASTSSTPTASTTQGSAGGAGGSGPTGTGGGGTSNVPDASGTGGSSSSDATMSSDATDATAPSDANRVDSTPNNDAAGEAGPAPKLNVLAIGELMTASGPEIHAPFVLAAKTWLTTESNLTVTHVESPNTITDALLANYNLVLQLNYTPWRWNAVAKAAFEKYLTEGKGGWVGLHHSGLYGPAVTQETWPWFFTFFGGINYRNYIATFAAATVHVEDAELTHPIFKGVTATFPVSTEEWYTWDKSPRPNVHVLATVDENSYMPNSTIKMGGDHPVVWTNDTTRGKNVYIFMGHHPNLFQNTAWVTMFRNAINWAGTPR